MSSTITRGGHSHQGGVAVADLRLRNPNNLICCPGLVQQVTAALTSLLYSGEQTDGTGLQYLRARYYDPASGRVTTR